VREGVRPRIGMEKEEGDKRGNWNVWQQTDRPLRFQFVQQKAEGEGRRKKKKKKDFAGNAERVEEKQVTTP